MSLSEGREEALSTAILSPVTSPPSWEGGKGRGHVAAGGLGGGGHGALQRGWAGRDKPTGVKLIFFPVQPEGPWFSPSSVPAGGQPPSCDRVLPSVFGGSVLSLQQTPR